MSELEIAAGEAKHALQRLNAARAAEKSTRQALADAEKSVRLAQAAFARAQEKVIAVSVHPIEHEHWF